MVSERVQDWIDKKSIMGGEMILVRDLAELLETNAIVTRVADNTHENLVCAGRRSLTNGASMYDYELTTMYNEFIKESEKI